MSVKYTDARNKATQKYIKKAYDTITVRVPKGKREEYKMYAESRGCSLNGFIIELIEREMVGK